MKRITNKKLSNWIGDDATKEGLRSIILNLVNGRYTVDTLRNDILSTDE